MKMTLTLLLLAGSLVRADVNPTLTSEFSGTSKTTGHHYRITQVEGGQWRLGDLSPCLSYPCDINANTTHTLVTPVLMSDARIADGSTEVKLSEELTITFVNNGIVPPRADGSREESYWKLTIKKAGKVQEEIKLSFYPLLKTT